MNATTTASTQATQSAQSAQPQHPILELLARYRAVFQHAWTHRAELAGPKRLPMKRPFACRPELG